MGTHFSSLTLLGLMREQMFLETNEFYGSLTPNRKFLITSVSNQENLVNIAF